MNILNSSSLQKENGSKGEKGMREERGKKLRKNKKMEQRMLKTDREYLINLLIIVGNIPFKIHSVWSLN